MNEPVHIISLGAGVQSSTMALMAARGEITPMPVAGVFADTGAEPRAVYEWLEEAIKFEVDLQLVKAKTDNMRGVPFLHRSCKPLSEVDFSTEEERGQLNMFNNECEGMCGV